MTPEGVQFLASGIEAGNSNNQALVFRHDLVNDKLSWVFTSLSDLLFPPDTTAPVLHSVSISPDEVNRGDSIRILLETEDTLSGIDEIKVDIVNPLGEQLHAISAQVENWISTGENMYAYDVIITDSAGNILCLNSRDSLLATFEVIDPAGISEAKKNNIHIYPNPSSGIFYFSVDPGIISIKVFNHLGESVKTYYSSESNFPDPTPNAMNNTTGYTGRAMAPLFNHPAGFYDLPFYVEMQSTTMR